MKRLKRYLPWIGLGLLVLVVAFRALRQEGLGLRGFPAPPRVLLGASTGLDPAARLTGVVRDGTGQPIAEALVLATFGDELAWTYSDLKGQFELERVPSGELQLKVLAREFRVEDFSTTAPGEGVELILDEPVREIRQLPELLRSDLEGSLVAALGSRGLLGYEILFAPRQPAHEFGQPLPVRAAVGADRGFRLADLIQGDYSLVILPPWARGGSWPNLCTPAQREYHHGPGSPILDIDLAAGEIKGRVQDDTGAAVLGALALVAPLERPERPWPAVASGADGIFTIGDLPPGEYLLEVTAGEAQIELAVTVVDGVTSEPDLAPFTLRAR
ncbi:MAG: carboxypeptidase-like regulatory domain-containing protein [bacterium]|jgi:hypothetical protein|nr:carboxypeptidase regulatory-like domain-containing protein [Planctomycetota bacterium]HIL52670.1 carboxypeptidase regulatory-like domain-containing protein [Planctomycetota bacterium]